MDRFKKHRFKKPLGKHDLYFLQKISLIGIVLLVILSLSFSGAGKTVQRYADHILSAILPSTVVELTNTEREQADLPELVRSPVLDEAAHLKAAHMIEEEYFAHFSPKNNISPWHWFKTVGYDYIHAGENLAIYFNNSKEVVQAWMDSPLHRDNILKERYTEIGVAALEGVYKGHQTVYVVQLFGTPAQANNTGQSVPVPEPPPASETKPETASVQGESTENKEPLRDLKDTPDIEEILIENEERGTEKDNSSIQIDTVPAGEGFAYVSEHIATSSPTLPASGIYSGFQDTSSSEDWLQLTYIFLATFIGLSLLSSIVISVFSQMYMQMLYGVLLLVILVSEVYIHIHYVIN